MISCFYKKVIFFVIMLFAFIHNNSVYASVLTIGCDLLDDSLNIIQARSQVQNKACFIDKDYSFIYFNPYEEELTRYNKSWKVLWSKKIPVKRIFGKTNNGILFYKTQEYGEERYCPVVYDKIVGIDQVTGKVLIEKSLKASASQIVNDFKIPVFFKEKTGKGQQCQFGFNVSSLSEMPSWKTSNPELGKKGNILIAPIKHASLVVFNNDLSRTIEFIDLTNFFRGGFQKAIALENGKIIFIKFNHLYVFDYFTKTVKRIYPRIAQNQFVQLSILGQTIKIYPNIDESKILERRNTIVEITPVKNQLIVSMIVDSKSLVHFLIDDEGNLLKSSPEVLKIKKELRNPFEFYRGNVFASFWSKWIFK